jgi:hypothetical protein
LHLAPEAAKTPKRSFVIRCLQLLEAAHREALAFWPAEAAPAQRALIVDAYEQRRAELNALVGARS